MTIEQKIEIVLKKTSSFLKQNPRHLDGGVVYFIDTKRYCSGTIWTVSAVLHKNNRYYLGVVTINKSDNPPIIIFHNNGLVDNEDFQDFVKKSSNASWYFSDFFARTN